MHTLRPGSTCTDMRGVCVGKGGEGGADCLEWVGFEVEFGRGGGYLSPHIVVPCGEGRRRRCGGAVSGAVLIGSAFHL